MVDALSCGVLFSEIRSDIRVLIHCLNEVIAQAFRDRPEMDTTTLHFHRLDERHIVLVTATRTAMSKWWRAA